MNAADDARARELHAAQRVTVAGAALDGALGIAKIAVGLLAQSQALLADGVHSLSDLATDAVVLLVTRSARARPDLEHPWGHGRFETLGTLVLGAVLLVVAGGIGQDAIARLFAGDTPVPGAAALLVAGVSIAGKEWIFRYTRRVAEDVRSDLLLANAWHSRTDAFSSIAVLVGVAGAMAGFPWLDLVAALVVAGMVGWIGWGLIGGAARELVDTGLPERELAELRLATLAVPGVLGVHQLRSRRMGSAVILDLDVEVAPEISVSEGHQIAWQVARRLRTDFDAVDDVSVHVDPALPGPDRPDPDAARPAPRAALPPRARAESDLLARWRPLLEGRPQRLALHYGTGTVDVELFVDGAADAGLEGRLAGAASDLPWLGSVRLWVRPPAP